MVYSIATTPDVHGLYNFKIMIGSPVGTHSRFGWNPEPVKVRRRREKYVTPLGLEIKNLRVGRLVTTQNSYR